MPINTDVSAGLYVTLPKETKEELRKVAAKNHRSMSKEVAYVLTQYLEEQKEKVSSPQ